MRQQSIAPPDETEYAPYYGRYVSLVPKGQIIELLQYQMNNTLWLMENVSESKGAYRYGDGKWTVKEVFGHINDAERIFAYRALCIARGDLQPLPGMEQDPYVANADFNGRPVKHLQGEYQGIRSSTIALFEGLSPEAWKRAGTASGFGVSVRALAYILAGHELHHLAVLKEKYGVHG